MHSTFTLVKRTPPKIIHRGQQQKTIMSRSTRHLLENNMSNRCIKPNNRKFCQNRQGGKLFALKDIKTTHLFLANMYSLPKVWNNILRVLCPSILFLYSCTPFFSSPCQDLQKLSQTPIMTDQINNSLKVKLLTLTSIQKQWNKTLWTLCLQSRYTTSSRKVM